MLERADWRDGSGKMSPLLIWDLCSVQFCAQDECYPPAPCFSGMIHLTTKTFSSSSGRHNELYRRMQSFIELNILAVTISTSPVLLDGRGRRKCT